ncbi:alpha/beta fold hydrolase [Cyanobacterium stanieri LEGE 03274]|uniref:Alpha/beta fold hydrolase n=1 Tax=Cyanobacterium stanieri LEGE 03274 TaxID=1828756 RepID=A0ABR9V7Y7_9CHRO|nr:alpha/beta fold hydrolase [Cyanobacterium stanieri]MBE9223659.1 alpha/beta fold hydrolase [Cyanobacterium stanieri LEGE 03274]
MNWKEKTGNQRDWHWRGWKIRYSYTNSEDKNNYPPIILLHGFGASIGHWRHNIPILKQHYRVYALDLLGFGASRKAYTNYDVTLWAQLVYDFWRTFINVPVIIIGNSIGSLIGLYATVQYPTMVDKLVMLSLPDLSARQKMLPKLLLPVVKTLESIVASPLLIRLIFLIARRPMVIRKWLGVAYVDKTWLDDELVNIIATPPQDKGAARTLIALSKSVNQSDFSLSARDLLGQVTIPMLLLWGKGDRFIPPTIAPQLARVNPLITLHLLDGLGHCLHDEKPDLFHQILFDWLRVIDNE